jgi:hypothetical protein
MIAAVIHLVGSAPRSVPAEALLASGCAADIRARTRREAAEVIQPVVPSPHSCEAATWSTLEHRSV